MQVALSKFEEYYKAKHSGHKLEPDHTLGTATLKARFTGGTKELSVSLSQALVLLLFNDSLELEFQDIKDQTRMGKYEITKKDASGQEIKVTLISTPSCYCLSEAVTDYQPPTLSRRRRVEEDVTESGLWEEESAEENSSRKGNRR